MLTSTVDVAAAVEGGHSRIGARLTIDLPTPVDVDFTHALASVDLREQMTTDLPDGVRDTAGIPVLSGDVVLSGCVDPAGDPRKHAAWLLNPDSAGSPLRHDSLNGALITYEEGPYVDGQVDPQYLPVTGDCWVNGYDLDNAAGAVTLHVTSVPPEADTTPDVPSVVTAPPFNAGLTSEFPMDAAIRSVYGDSTWPATRDECVLAVGFRSSLWPEVGGLDTGQDQPLVKFEPGLMGTALGIAVPDLRSYGQVTYDLAGSVGTTLFVEWWQPDNASSSNTVAVKVVTGPNGEGISVARSASMSVLFTDPSGLLIGLDVWAPPAGSGEYTSFTVTLPPVGGNTYTVTYRIGAVTHTVSSGMSSARTSLAWDSAQVIVAGLATIEALQVTTESAPAPNDGFDPAAVLDPSLNPLTVVTEITADTHLTDALQTMAAAELGYIRKSRDGKIRFTNRINLLAQAVGRDITSATSLAGLNTSMPPAGTYHRVTVPFTEWDFGDRGLVWQLGSRKKIPLRSTVVWQQTLTDLACALDTGVALLPDMHDPSDGGSYYRASVDKAGTAAHPGLHITVRQVSGQRIEITARNSTGQDAYLVSSADNTDLPAGTAGTGLWVGGIPVTAGDEATVTALYGDGVGTLALDSNPYLQDHDTALDIAWWVENQVYVDIRDFTDVAIQPDHRIETGDLHHLIDPDPSNVDEYVLVWGRAYTAQFVPAGQSGGTRDMSLEVRALGPPDAPLGGLIPDRCEADVFWAYA